MDFYDTYCQAPLTSQQICEISCLFNGHWLLLVVFDIIGIYSVYSIVGAVLVPLVWCLCYGNHRRDHPHIILSKVDSQSAQKRDCGITDGDSVWPLRSRYFGQLPPHWQFIRSPSGSAGDNWFLGVLTSHSLAELQASFHMRMNTGLTYMK